MKANQGVRTAVIAALLATGLVAACVAPPPRAIAARPAAAPPAPAPAARIAADPLLTPGVWRWRDEDGQSVARFADGLLVLRCDRARHTVALWRAYDPVLSATAAAATVPMSVDTTAMTRPLAGTPDPGPPAGLLLQLAAADPLLDAMVFSRGHFAVEAAGLPTLTVPSWPEVARVVEDCR